MTDEETGRFLEALLDACAALEIPLTDEQAALCARHASLVLETNAHTNLTRITEPEAMALKHYADSLTALIAVSDLKPGASVCDVGTGAGYPGVPLKIVRPDIKLTLLDSLNKRVRFNQESCKTLGLENVTCLHSRAEESKEKKYDLVVARAVAAMPKLLGWCAGLVAPGGRLLALKGPDVLDELAEARPLAQKLGLTLVSSRALTLPDDEGSGRTLVMYRRG